MPITISSLLRPELVELNLTAGSMDEAISATAGLLAQRGEVLDFTRFCDELLMREKLCTTAIGNGVAFPHARSDSVREIVMAVGRSAAGVECEGGAQHVHLLFVIGTPKERVREYLALVGQLARQLKSSKLCEDLLEAKSAEEFLARLDG